MPNLPALQHRENLLFSTLFKPVVIVVEMKCDLARHAYGAA